MIKEKEGPFKSFIAAAALLGAQPNTDFVEIEL
jgi:hypothetical protein